MRRTIVLSVAAGAVIAFAWLRLEVPREGGRLGLVLALALAPSLLPRTGWRLAASLPAVALAAAVAFDRSPTAAPEEARVGLRSFYDVSLPFDPAARPEMHGLVLLAVFAFALAVSHAVAERRAVTAAAVFVIGAGWPATLVPGRSELAQGALILAGALVLLAALRPRSLTRPGRIVVTGGAVVLGALIAASIPAVARDQLVGWETWDPYEKRSPMVGVQYVWDAQYNGVEFPDEPTKLLEIAAPPRSTYWRATTLDLYRSGRWLESLHPTLPRFTSERAELTSDADLPASARRPERWIEQQIRVVALRDTHLVGASVPTAYAFDDQRDADYSAGGIARLDGGLRRGFDYTVWSYSSSPTPRRLAATPAEFTDVDPSYFEVEPGVSVPSFGVPGRDARVLELIRTEPGLGQYERLYSIARRVGGSATPYGTVVKLETWLRTHPDFLYEEQPPRPVPGVPALVDFVARTREGYCQHYAGAMALMLRYLGIPARVAAGFTSGRFDEENDTWSVTDRNAHTWVEVWFKDFGWLPFDPTPGRGQLEGAYTSASLGFRGREALEALGQEGTGLGLDGRRAIEQLRRRLARERALDPALSPTGAGQSDDSRADPTVFVLLVGALGVALAIAAVKIVRRRLRYVGGGPRRVASACRRELAEFVRDQQVDVRDASTLGELGATVREALAVDPSRFVAAAGAARFGPEESADEQARSARLELRRLKRAIRSRLSARRRLHGLVSLRSLRA
jgi:transglutaminase-like putative cysteine protease